MHQWFLLVLRFVIEYDHHYNDYQYQIFEAYEMQKMHNAMTAIFLSLTWYLQHVSKALPLIKPYTNIISAYASLLK